MIELRDSLEWMTTSGARGIERNGWSEAALKQTLKHAIEKLGSKSLMIFVDALDECEQEQASEMVAFFEELCELAEVSQVSLQICFSSRHYPTIVIQKGTELTLEYEPGHMEDIQHYIKSKSRLGKTKQAEALRSEIFQKSSNIFLWVVLVLDILNSEYKSGSNSIKKISERLNGIPPGLNDLFEMILKRDGQNLEELHLCLKLILFANRPLKPQELYFATQIGIDEDCTGFWDQEDVNIDQMKLFVRNSSKGLAEVTKNKASDVQFIHESVRDFLLGRYETQLSGVPGNFVGLGHETLKNCCLAQLNAVIDQKVVKHFNFSSSNFWECRNMKYSFLNTTHPAQRSKEAQSRFQEEIKLRFPFLDYSVSNILYHANLAQQNYIEQADFLAEFPTRLWVFVNNYFENHEIRRYTDSITLLYLLAERNLANLIRTYSRKDSCFDITEQRYGPSIFAALATGSDEAAQTLLKIEAETHASNSLLHDLCQKYQPNNSENECIGRSFTYSRRVDLTFHLLRYDHEMLLIFLLISDDIWIDSKMTDRGESLLMEAVEMNRSVVTTFLLERTTDINFMGGVQAMSFLQQAVIRGQMNIVELLLERGAEVNYKGQDRIPLVIASSRGQLNMVELLLEYGAEIECRDSSNQTPLIIAIYKGYLDMVKLLLKKGARIDYGENNRETPLTTAIHHGHKDIAKLLLEKGARIDYRENNGDTPLTTAIRHGHEDIAKLLLEKGAGSNTGGTNKPIPLMIAVYLGNKNITQLLLEKGAKTDCRDPNNQTPLMAAVLHGHKNVVELLLENNAEVNCVDFNDETLIMKAIVGGYASIASLLLRKGARFDCEKDLFGTVLLKSSQSGRKEMAKFLLQNGMNANLRDNSPVYKGWTPLMHATSHGHEAMTKLLLENGAEINAKCDSGSTSLYRAAAGGFETITELLLLKGNAKVNPTMEYNWDPLKGAIENGHGAVVAVLLEQGFYSEAENKDMNLLLLQVAQETLVIEDLSLLRLCLEKFHGINQKDEKGQTPLFWAIYRGHMDMVKLLIEKGASIELKDSRGYTPLIYALLPAQLSLPIVKILLDHGADINAEDNEGWKPLHIIESNATSVALLGTERPVIEID